MRLGGSASHSLVKVGFMVVSQVVGMDYIFPLSKYYSIRDML